MLRLRQSGGSNLVVPLLQPHESSIGKTSRLIIIRMLTNAVNGHDPNDGLGHVLASVPLYSIRDTNRRTCS